MGQWYQFAVTTKVHLTGVQAAMGDYAQSHLFSSFAELMAGF